MPTTPIDNTAITTDFNVDELTQGTLTGNGVFDVLLQTLRLHLDREFTSGRITGTAYATVYSQAITAFLAQAAQYALSKAKLPLELQLLQEQVTLTQKQQDQITAAIRQTNYVTDFQLPEEIKLIKRNQDQAIAQANKIATDTIVAVKQGHLVDSQVYQVRAETNQVNATVALKLPKEVLQVEAQTALLAYDLANIKPVEKINLENTGLGIIAQTANTTQTTSNLVKQGSLLDSQKVVTDKEALNITAQISQTTYKTNIMMPEELKILRLNQDQIKSQVSKVSVETLVASKQGNLIDAQICEVKANANKTNVEVATKLPEEIEILKRNQIQLTAQTSEVNYRVATLLPSQTAQNTAQTSQIVYSTSYVLPSQVALTNAQKDSADAQTALYNQKKVTELAQTTTTPASGSVLGVQNSLMQQQSTNYIRDAEQKAAKMLIDTWSVRHNAEPNGNPITAVNRLQNEDVGAAVTKLLNGIGVT